MLVRQAAVVVKKNGSLIPSTRYKEPKNNSKAAKNNLSLNFGKIILCGFAVKNLVENTGVEPVTS